MVFDAHIKAFEYMGGSPKRGIYDNMKTAVQKVLTRIFHEASKACSRKGDNKQL